MLKTQAIPPIVARTRTTGRFRGSRSCRPHHRCLGWHDRDEARPPKFGRERFEDDGRGFADAPPRRPIVFNADRRDVARLHRMSATARVGLYRRALKRESRACRQLCRSSISEPAGLTARDSFSVES